MTVRFGNVLGSNGSVIPRLPGADRQGRAGLRARLFECWAIAGRALAYTMDSIQALLDAARAERPFDAALEALAEALARTAAWPGLSEAEPRSRLEAFGDLAKSVRSTLLAYAMPDAR